jgi:carbonic anhydrase/acetyltransferase-like protein (isoleucine patch superfamily)
VLIEHQGRRPTVDPSAWVAPTAVLSGVVRVGADARILHGAVLTDAGGAIAVGERAIIMEQALVRGRGGRVTEIGREVIIGPFAHVNGALVEDGAFIATGAALFPNATIGAGAEVRIHGVVHVNSRLEPGGLVPIGWVAVGDPAQVLPPDRHEDIWAIQEGLDFPGTVFGIPRETPDLTAEAARRYADLFAAHREDRVLER